MLANSHRLPLMVSQRTELGVVVVSGGSAGGLKNALPARCWLALERGGRSSGSGCGVTLKPARATGRSDPSLSRGQRLRAVVGGRAPHITSAERPCARCANISPRSASCRARSEPPLRYQGSPGMAKVIPGPARLPRRDRAPPSRDRRSRPGPSKVNRHRRAAGGRIRWPAARSGQRPDHTCGRAG